MNEAIAPDAAGPLVEFLSEAIAVLESDLLMVSSAGVENTEEIAEFKQRFAFAFQALPAETADEFPAEYGLGALGELEIDPESAAAPPPEPDKLAFLFAELEPDGDIPAEI